MNEPSLNYWVYRIHRIGINGQPVFAAAYMAATHLKSIEMDLGSEQSHFRGFLKTYTRIEPEEFAHQHQLEAQARVRWLSSLLRLHESLRDVASRCASISKIHSKSEAATPKAHYGRKRGGSLAPGDRRGRA